jgi:FixJ family two-component response regulator
VYPTIRGTKGRERRSRSLGISEITVKAHRGQLMRKMQADSLAGLVTMTARLKLGPEERI